MTAVIMPDAPVKVDGAVPGGGDPVLDRDLSLAEAPEMIRVVFFASD